MQRRAREMAQFRKPDWKPNGNYGHKGTLYDPALHDALVYNLRLAFGGNAGTIASALGVAEMTLRGWLDRYPSFREAWDDGGLLADAAVARSFYKSATTGHTLQQERAFYNAKQDKLVIARVTERTPPSTQAQINWLSNRAPKLWRSLRTATELTGTDGEPLSLPPVIVVRAVASVAEARAIEQERLLADERRKTIEGDRTTDIWPTTE